MNFLDHKDRAGGLLMLVFSLAYLRFVFEIPEGAAVPGDAFFTPRTLPLALAAGGIICSLLLVLRTLGAGRNADAGSTANAAKGSKANPADASTGNAADADAMSIRRATAGMRWRPFAGLVALMAAYAAAFDWLGFLLATFLFLLLGFTILGERRFRLSLALAALLPALMWLALTQLFGMHLDSGALLRALAGSP